MYCRECGASNDLSHKFCVKCGKGLPLANATPPGASQVVGARLGGTTPIAPMSLSVSRLKLSRGMVVSASLILIVCFFNPLIACSAPFTGSVELSGLDIVLAGLSGGEFELGKLLWISFALIPIISVRLLLRTWAVMQRDARPRCENQGIPGLVVVGALLVLLWIIVRIGNITMDIVAAGYQFTGYYRGTWLALMLAGSGFYLERQETAEQSHATHNARSGPSFRPGPTVSGRLFARLDAADPDPAPVADTVPPRVDVTFGSPYKW